MLDRAAALSGNMVVPVTEIPGRLTHAMLADPDGLLVGVAKLMLTPGQPAGPGA